LLPRGNIYWYDAEGKQIASNTNIADYGYRIFFQYGEGTGPGPRPDDPNDDPDNPDNPDQPDDPTPGDFTNSKWGSDGEYGLLALPSGTNEYGTERVIGADGTLWYYAYSPESDAVEDIKTTTYNLYLNAIDQKGNKLFGDKGMVVSNYPNRSWTEIGQTLYANSDGSVTMVVRDCRNDEAQGSLTYTAYRFRKDGTSVWDRDGINIDEAGNYSFACGMTITELTDGTNVFVWMRSPTYTGSSMVLERCHVSKEGVKLNKLEDLRIGNPASDYNSYPALVAGENGTYYLVYARTSSQSIYVLKYNADGSNAWPSVSSRGVSIYSGGWGSVNMLQVRLNVKSDGKGGVLIAYNAAPGSSDDPYHAYISWVRPDGSLGFTNSEGKAPVRLSYDENNAQRMPDIIPSPDGNGFVAAILYYNQAYQQYEGLTLQKIDSLGNLQWGDIGYEFQPQSSQNIGNAKLQPGYKGQFLLTWTNGSNDKPYSDTKNYYAIFNSSDHSFVHPEQGIVTMSTKQFYRTNLTSLVNKKEGYWILHWKQTYKPIYAGDREQENEDELKDHHCLALITFDGKMVVGQKEEPKELDFTNSKWGTDGVYGLRALPTGTNQYANEQVMGVDGTLWYFIYHPSHTTVADLDHTVYTMYLNGIDKMGNKMFGDLGIEISSYPNASWTKVNQYLCANSDSTVTVAISDERSGNGSNVTFTGYRFRPDGTSVWDRDGVNLDENNHYEAGVWMNIIELPNGTNVFAWTRPAVYSGQYTQYIERVHVSKEGQVLTKLDDLRLGKDAEFYADPMLVLGENGSYYMIYARTSAYSIYAKKYNADGSEAWSNVSARGLSLFTGSWGEMPTLQTRINAGRDGKGGFYITYNYQPDMSQPYHAYIAWVKPDGTLGYTNSDGKAPMRLSYDEYNCQRMPLVIPSPDGNGFIATFTEYNYGTQSYQAYIMQKIDSLGVLQWGDEGISVEPIDEQNAGSHTIQKGKDNQFMISWLIGGTYNNFNDTKHKMAIVNSEDGTYAVAPKPVYDVQANRTSLSSVINNVDGYWVMHWTQQYRPYYETDRVPTNAEEEAKDNYCLALVTFDGTVVKGAGSNVLPGDANNDGVVDVSDITAIASYILNGAATGASWNADNADANQDGQIDVSDITATAAIILGVK
ncbi:MAG: dockerin type I repeat-containing protein, partial [Prevotellaceae bacterium]|nr:dockerin type I repeat-containing protein [Prevotellaceae bacterium]